MGHLKCTSLLAVVSQTRACCLRTLEISCETVFAMKGKVGKNVSNSYFVAVKRRKCLILHAIVV